MNSLERRAVALLAAVYGLRIAGLFLILPVFALYAGYLEGYTPLLIGLALGAYGLTQAILQIPFGMLSDRFGRKPVIAGGLLLFALGSVIAANATHIWVMILGRAVQGSGAIAAAIMAMVADLTREEQRTKAMAVVGMTIGAAFVLSLIIGPILNGLIGVPGIFWMTGALALCAIAVVVWGLPTPVRTRARSLRGVKKEFTRIIRDTQLLRLDSGIFILHMVMTAMFVVLPGVIVKYMDLAASAHWKVYLPVMLAGFAGMLPFLVLANKRQLNRRVMAGGVGVMALSQILFFFAHQTAPGLTIGLWLFFAGFSLLEAMLPSLVSRLAPPDSKGAAIGIYSSSQFLGAFAGGVLGGGLYGAYGIGAVFIFTTLALGLWLALIFSMAEPRFLSTHELRVGRKVPADAEKLAKQLVRIPGVAEAVVIAEEGIAYLKVDNRLLDKKRLQQFQAG